MSAAEPAMARGLVYSDPERRPAFEPLYDRDPRTGATIEIFYADRTLARSFGAAGAGWFHWLGMAGRLPNEEPQGPFSRSYRAYCDAWAPASTVRKMTELRTEGKIPGRFA